MHKCPSCSCPQRSDQENRFYWGVLIPSVTAFLNHKHQHDLPLHRTAVHHALKTAFLGVDESGDPISTTGLSIEEFAIYLEEIQAHFATEHGYQVIEADQTEWDSAQEAESTGASHS